MKTIRQTRVEGGREISFTDHSSIFMGIKKLYLNLRADAETGERPFPIGSAAAQRIATIKMQRECWCGGREQCEHEQEEDIAEMMAARGQQDCEEVVSVRRREAVVERKEAWWKREEERKRQLRMREWEVKELERTGRLEDDPVYGMKAPWRSRGRGRPIAPREQSPGHSPERYVNEEIY